MATAAAASNKFESFFETTLEDADPEIFGAIRNELGRQRHEIEPGEAEMFHCRLLPSSGPASRQPSRQSGRFAGRR